MELTGKKVAILVGPRFHDEEATKPKDYLRDKGFQVEYIGTYKGKLVGKAGRRTVEVNRTFAEANPTEFDGIVIPGGGAPEILRLNDKVLEFVRTFWQTGRPVAAICHGPQVLISAGGILTNRKVTCYAGIRDDVKLAGGLYEDLPVVIDENLITSRRSEDLPQFNEAFTEALAKAPSTSDVDSLDALDALGLAIAREKGARDFYRAVSERFAEPSVKNKFSYLSSLEQGHFDELSSLYEQLSGGAKPNTGKRAAEVGRHSLTKSMTVEDAVKIAMDAEKHAHDFYERAAGRANSKGAQDMFEYLAAEELEHQRLLSVDLATHRGGQGHFQWATFWDIPPGMDDLW